MRFRLLPLLLLPSLLGCPADEAVIEVSPASVDFGDVEIWSTSSQAVEVTNSGGAVTTVVFQLAGDGPFDVALAGALEIQPDDARIILVESTPQTAGTTTDVLRLLWGEQSLEIPLSVNGIEGGDDVDGDGFSSLDDCDDEDPDINPDATEVCDGVDNNCSGVIDDDADVDGDGSYACADCADDDADNAPDNDEVCDGADNNCDDVIDEGFDEDDDGVSTCDTEPDCNDENAAVFPGATEVCNGIDEDCDTEIDEDFLGPTDDVDGDGDPFCTDCDDEDDEAFNGGIEICDGKDNNCDSEVDENGVDLDGDSYSTCDDCDDGNGAINPGAVEICENGVDEDCTGEADDGCSVDADGDGFDFPADCNDADDTVYPGAPDVCDGTDDNDCDSVTDPSEADDDTDGQSECDGDCDDAEIAVYTGAPDVCDGIDDNDCDTVTDASEADADIDGQSECDGDCDDGDDTVYDGAPELCDAVDDNDCDTVTDSNESDDDTDGQSECDGDCDDTDTDYYDGAPEFCSDGVDFDCDGIDATPCTSCSDALAADATRAGTDAVFTIDSDGAGPLGEVDVWCDMSTLGGGWTLVLRTTPDGLANGALVTDYTTVYGTDAGDPAGSDPVRLSAQHWEAVSPAGDLMSRHDLRKEVDGTSCDPLFFTLSGSFAVDVPGGSGLSYTFSGTDDHGVVNQLASPAVFSSTDEGPRSNCVNVIETAPWFYDLCGRNLPSANYYTSAGEPEPLIRDEVLNGTDAQGFTVDDVCGGDAVDGPATTTYNYENLHEYYVR